MSCVIVNCLSGRATLAIMAFFMFLVTQMIRVNLYIALVAINEENVANRTDSITQQKNTWNDKGNSLILGAFYWSYWATELPGGVLAQQFGGKKIMGLGVAVAAILNLLLPMSYNYHYIVPVLFRAIQGLALGVTWPVMHWLSARWIPKTERSKFMTTYHGAAVGTAITYPLSGFIITKYGWEFVFYFIGVISIIWCFAWWILVFDSPRQHPRLLDEERKYLAEALEDTVAFRKTDKPKTPWRCILTSKSFWAVLMASQGLMWGSITLSMQTPLYFSQVHQLDMKSTGLLSGIPEISKFIFSILFSATIDKLITKKTISLTTARKLSVTVSEFIPANFLILLGLFGSDDIVLSSVLLSCISLVGGASSSGSLANIVDLSPNHAGTLLGIIKSLTVFPGVLSPLIVTQFVSNEADKEATRWRNVFFFLAAVYVICCSVFLIFGSGEVQHWNKTTETDKEEATYLDAKKRESKEMPFDQSKDCV